MKRVKLPIDNFKNEIIKTVNENPVTVLVAETGAGKSTRIPQMLHADGYDVVVTEPRRLAAKSVAKRVATELGCDFGSTVGFRTAVDRCDSKQTEILFVTDGLQLVRELSQRKKTGKKMCLVLDEVHEWNKNIETLVAWSKKMISEGFSIKIVLMSATLDAGKLSKYFDNAPVINVPGRCFPVVGSPTHENGIMQSDADSVFEEISLQAASGKNTLVFLPGKKEISNLYEALKKANTGAKILQLHGDLDPDIQDLAFKNFPQGKVVLCTNIAQTSITINDINAVVDSGLERRIELCNGVETLVLGNISKADVKQRAGRAGRVQEGEYILCNNTEYVDFSEYPIPEIQRTLLDQTVLRLASAGLDATELEFFHDPGQESLIQAKKLLIALGAFDQDGKITKLGYKINRFPTSVVAAKMILESLRFGCLSAVVDIAVLMSSSYMSIKRQKKDSDPEHFQSWVNLILNKEKEYLSEFILEREIFLAAKNLDKKRLAEKGISPKGFFRTMDVRKQLFDALKTLGIQVSKFSGSISDENIAKSIASAMVHSVYKSDYSGELVSSDGDQRQLDRKSSISVQKFAVGFPKNIQFVNRRGYKTEIQLLSSVTLLKEGWVEEIAPQLVSVETGLSPYVNSDDEKVYSKTRKVFAGFELSEEYVLDPNHPDADELLFNFFERKEQKRVSEAFSVASSNDGYTDWISNPDEVTPYLTSILSKVDVARAKNGETIQGFVGLFSDSYSDFKVLVYRTLEEAKLKTETSMKRLLLKSTKELRKTPEEFLGKESEQLKLMFEGGVKNLTENIKIDIENFLEIKENFVSAIKDIVSNIVETFTQRVERLQVIEMNFNKKLNSFSHDLVSSKVSETQSEISKFVSNYFDMEKESVEERYEEIFSKIDEACKLSALRENEELEKEVQKESLLNTWAESEDDIESILHRENGFEGVSYSKISELQSIIVVFNRSINNCNFSESKKQIHLVNDFIESLRPEVVEINLENLAGLWGANFKKS